MSEDQIVVDYAWAQTREIRDPSSGLREFLHFQRTRHLPDGPTEWAFAIGPPEHRSWKRCAPQSGTTMTE